MAQLPSNSARPNSLAQTIANLGPQPAILKTSTVDPRALAAGIKASFASMNFKGKTWGIRYRGNTTQLLQRGPNNEILGSIPTVDVVIVKSATAISKTFYIDKYKEGNFAPPDCWSTNGIVPDPAAPKKQNETCRGCRWDAFGSRTMDDGRKGKACQDSKRVAVVPAGDLKNEGYGGPMLLKLPPSAFNALSELEVQLHMQGYAYFGIVMRLSFDHEAPYPKVMFTPVRVLNEHEAQEVINLQQGDVVERILSEELTEVTGDPKQPTPDEVPPKEQPVTSVVTPKSTADVPLHSLPATAFSVPPGAQVAFVPQSPPASASAASTSGPTLTPEQQKIKDLEAQLAAAKASVPAASPTDKALPGGPAETPAKAPRRRRTQPVTPAETSTNGQPAAQAAPAPTSNNDDEGDAPPDLESRIDALFGPKGG